MFWRKKAIKSEELMKPSKDYRAIALTDLGSVRDHNEDQILFVRPSDPHQRNTKGFLALVADGMGGHSAGEIASALAIRGVSQNYYNHPNSNPLVALKQSMIEANNLIFNEGQKSESNQGMGTTCTVVVILNGSLHIAHIGDSRAYLVKDRQIYQLTEDHTYVRDLVKSGKINPLEAIHHPQRNVLTQAMGTNSGRYGDVFLSDLSLDQNDTLLLCSDGLYEYFTNEEIKTIILEKDFRDASTYLLEEAKSRGGHDNISLLLVQESGEQIESASPTQILNQ